MLSYVRKVGAICPWRLEQAQFLQSLDFHLIILHELLLFLLEKMQAIKVDKCQFLICFAGV